MKVLRRNNGVEEPKGVSKLVRPELETIPVTTSNVFQRFLGWASETWQSNRIPLTQAFVVFIGMRIMLNVIAVFASAMLPLQEGLHYTTSFSDNIWLDVWTRWDSEHYIAISRTGYQPDADVIAFFPLYPILMASLAPLLGGDQVLAGIIISTIATFTALLYIFKLAEWEFGPGIARRAVLYMAIYPMAFFMLAIYTESLFLTLSIATFYYARRGHWGVAVPTAFLSGLTRPTGVLLFVPLAYEVWRQSGGHLHLKDLFKNLNLWGVVAAAAAPVGWILWAAYLAWMSNNLFMAIQSTDQPPWWRSSNPPWETLITSIEQLARSDVSPVLRAIATQDLIAAVLLIEAAIFSWWVLPRVYAIYCTTSAWMVLSFTVHNTPAPMLSLPRYTLAIFPIIFLLAKLGANPQWDRIIVISSATLLGIYTAMFATWYLVF